ncbi:MAG: NAD(P)-dependent alcohol dehydrogenase [Chromatiaceae bacterium]|nr:NAD(P)-dependent alcohol dehydrogenase [Chromatiaceae bacterium]
MKAITYREYGPPEVLRIEDVPKPSYRDDEVLVRVRAAEATKGDCELRRFRFAVSWFWLPLRLALGVRRPRRRVLGGYFAGEIAAVGKAVTEFAVGQRVYGATGLRFGAYGAYVTLPAAGPVAPMPATMDFTEAAAVPLGGLNALHFLNRARIQPGDAVLINGAGGSIGAHAVQLAKAMGARVTAVDHGRKEAFLRALGAEAFIDYRQTDFTASAGAYDVILSMVAGATYGRCLRALRPNGRYLLANPRLSDMLRAPITHALTGQRVDVAFAPETRAGLDTLRVLIEQGKLVPIVDRVEPMEQAAEAHRRVECEERLGAVVLAIAEWD